jgi:DNA repair ATPase RecN
MKFRDIMEVVMSSPENDPSYIKKSIEELKKIFNKMHKRYEEILKEQEDELDAIEKLRDTGLIDDDTSSRMIQHVANLGKQLDNMTKEMTKIEEEIARKMKGKVGEN